MSGALRRGLAAGAVGTTVLNTITYLDMATRGRPPSEAPKQMVDAMAEAVGMSWPGDRSGRDNRRTAAGALSGIGTGLAVGAAASLARRAGFRPPRVLGVLATAAAAMAGSDVPMAALGVGDPRTWPASAWLADAVPHLGYGLAVDAVLRHDPRPEGEDSRVRPSRTLVLRCALLGAAAGSRSSLGLAAPALLLRGRAGAGSALTGRRAGTATALALGGELVGDKLPQTPSRLERPALSLRFASGAVGALTLARHEDARPAAPVVAAALGTAAGAWGGAAWRGWAARQVPDWQAALVEDGVAVLLALAACLPGRAARGHDLRRPPFSAH